MTDDSRRPRAHTVGIPRRPRDGGEELLVERYTRDGPFYRPIGGGIEFGEHSHETVVREFREETGYAVEPRAFLGVSENVFTFDGTSGHEVSLVYEVAFLADEPYESEIITVTKESDGSTREATWHTPAELRAYGEPCYPEGLFDLLGGADRITTP